VVAEQVDDPAEVDLEGVAHAGHRTRIRHNRGTRLCGSPVVSGHDRLIATST